MHLLPVIFLAAAVPLAGCLIAAVPAAAVFLDSPDSIGRPLWHAEEPPSVHAPLVPLTARPPAEMAPSPARRKLRWLHSLLLALAPPMHFQKRIRLHQANCK